MSTKKCIAPKTRSDSDRQKLLYQIFGRFDLNSHVLRFTQANFTSYFRTYLDTYCRSKKRNAIFNAHRTGLSCIQLQIFRGLQHTCLSFPDLTPAEKQYMQEVIPREVTKVQLDEGYLNSYIVENATRPLLGCYLDKTYQLSLTRPQIFDMFRGVNISIDPALQGVVKLPVKPLDLSAQVPEKVARCIFSCWELGVALSQPSSVYNATGKTSRLVQPIKTCRFVPKAYTRPGPADRVLRSSTLSTSIRY